MDGEIFFAPQGKGTFLVRTRLSRFVQPRSINPDRSGDVQKETDARISSAQTPLKRLRIVPGEIVMKNCPKCDSVRIHQSRRRGFIEKIALAVIFVRPFRCEWCDARFFRWSLSENPNAERSATSN
jgi:hypothetical protein